MISPPQLNVLRQPPFWSMTIHGDTLHRSDITLTHDLVARLDLVFDFDILFEFREDSIAHLQQTLHDHTILLLLRRPGLVQFATCMSFSAGTNLSESR